MNQMMAKPGVFRYSDQNTVRLDRIPEWPPIEESSMPGFIKHIQCEGARFHNLHWDALGIHCSDPRCVINAKKKS